MLNNIIWMMCRNHVSDSVAKYAVFGNSLGSKIMFHYLNIKACLVANIIGGDGNYHSRWHYLLYTYKFTAYPLQTLKLILKGHFKELSLKASKVLMRKSFHFIKWHNLY